MHSRGCAPHAGEPALEEVAEASRLTVVAGPYPVLVPVLAVACAVAVRPFVAELA